MFQTDKRRSLTDRRQSWRFPLECELVYKTLHKRKPTTTGTGKTLNVSSSGMCFTAQQDFPVGTRLELSIIWPVQRSDNLPLILTIFGRVTRSASSQLALSIERHQFRIGKSEPLAA